MLMAALTAWKMLKCIFVLATMTARSSDVNFASDLSAPNEATMALNTLEWECEMADSRSARSVANSDR
jgi:hypothetical protein